MQVHSNEPPVFFSRKNELPWVGLEPRTLCSPDRVLFLLSYQGSSASRALSLQHNTKATANPNNYAWMHDTHMHTCGHTYIHTGVCFIQYYSQCKHVSMHALCVGINSLRENFPFHVVHPLTHFSAHLHMWSVSSSQSACPAITDHPVTWHVVTTQLSPPWYVRNTLPQ